MTKRSSGKFGEMRVLDTPLAESNIVGTSVGAAMMGKRPVAEIQFAEYILPAVNQILNEAAKVRYRSDNDWNAPMVIERRLAAVFTVPCTTQSIESIFVSTPDLKSSCRQHLLMQRLINGAIKDNDPSCFRT